MLRCKNVPEHLVAIRFAGLALSVKYLDEENQNTRIQRRDKGHHGEVRLPAGFSQTLFNSSSPIKFISNNISESLLFLLL